MVLFHLFLSVIFCRTQKWRGGGRREEKGCGSATCPARIIKEEDFIMKKTSKRALSLLLTLTLMFSAVMMFPSTASATVNETWTSPSLSLIHISLSYLPKRYSIAPGDDKYAFIWYWDATYTYCLDVVDKQDKWTPQNILKKTFDELNPYVVIPR